MLTYRFWHRALYSSKPLQRGRGSIWAVSQSAGDQTLFLLMYSIWMPWFHLCRVSPATGMQSKARKHCFWSTCYWRHSPSHATTSAPCSRSPSTIQPGWIWHILNVWHENDLQLHIQWKLCTFPGAGGSVYVKHNGEVLWGLISELIAQTFCLLLCGWGRPMLKSCLALSKALSGSHNSWQEQVCLHGAVSPSFPNLPGEDNIGESRWGFAIATPGSPLLGWHLQPRFLVKVRLAVFPWHPAYVKAAETFSWQVVYKISKRT